MVAARRIIPMVASVPNDLAQIYDRIYDESVYA